VNAGQRVVVVEPEMGGGVSTSSSSLKERMSRSEADLESCSNHRSQGGLDGICWNGR